MDLEIMCQMTGIGIIPRDVWSRYLGYSYISLEYVCSV